MWNCGNGFETPDVMFGEMMIVYVMLKNIVRYLKNKRRRRKKKAFVRQFVMFLMKLEEVPLAEA